MGFSCIGTASQQHQLDIAGTSTHISFGTEIDVEWAWLGRNTFGPVVAYRATCGYRLARDPGARGMRRGCRVALWGNVLFALGVPSFGGGAGGYLCLQYQPSPLCMH